MEEKFYLDDFELSLQEQANHFKMAPTKKVWHGIYNDLHPGRRWPSVMVSLVLIFSIVFVGYINSNTDSKATGTKDQVRSASNEKEISKPEITSTTNKFQTQPSGQNSKTVKSVSSNNKTLAFSAPGENSHTLDNSISNKEINRTKEGDQAKEINQTGSVSPPSTTARINSNQPLSQNILNGQENYSLNKQREITEVENNMNKQISVSNDTRGHVSNQPEIYTSFQHSVVQNSHKDLQIEVPGFIKSTNNKSLALIINTDQNNLKALSTEGDKSVLAKVKKKNEKISWVYYAGTFLSTVSFSGETLKDNNSLNVSSQPLPQVAQKDMKVLRKPALGFEAGLKMNYSLTKRLQFITGVHITRSGYDVISNLVHPTLATLTLKDPSTGNIYSRSFVTHYGDGTGKSTVTLRNYSYQASIPVGLQYMLWDNGKLQLNIAADFEPSYILNPDAFILASNGKNYVNVPDLMRKWNFSSNFAPFISFRSSKLKWNIGPNIRYQWLSTYQKNYTIKEHLIDYGIRIGISK
ncbi:MAG: hypothetical protein ABJA90_02060 [Ginsengibacter sp.]